jgi:putative ABC transport system permease protein
MDFLNVIFNILTSGLPCCLIAIGVFLTFRLLDFADMTAEGSFLLSASLTAACIAIGINPFLATFLGMLMGAACGFVTGVLNRLLKIPKLLSGIITLTASASLALLVMGISSPTEIFRSQIPLSLNTNQTIYSIFYPKSNPLSPFPLNKLIETLVMVVMVSITIVAVYYFFGTEYGMAIRATGMNEKMARSQGINTNIACIACVSISNALIGLGGALYVQDTLSVGAGNAAGYLVIGLASILIGEAIFGKRSFKNWLISVALGAILYFTIITIAIKLGLPTQLKSLLYAILITIALCIPLIKQGFTTIFNKIRRKRQPC